MNIAYWIIGYCVLCWAIAGLLWWSDRGPDDGLGRALAKVVFAFAPLVLPFLILSWILAGIGWVMDKIGDAFR